jgi:hypothetical protein
MARRSVVRAKGKSVWSKEVRKMLVEFVDEFRNSTTPERRRLFSDDILPALRILYPNVDNEQWKTVKTDAKRWFQNTARRRGLRDRFRLANNVTLRKVICWDKKAEIEATVRELSNAEPGTSQYLSSYSKGLEQVMSTIDKSEMARLQAMKEKWMEKEHPVELQRR